MFDEMFDVIAQVLAFFYSLVPNYALSIALLTMVVMVVVLPLTLTSTKSMIKMQRLQPEMREIQQKYKDDRPRMNEELMAFYQANSINPVGGCLPMFIQLPIFLVLFQVIQGLTRRLTETGIMLGQTSQQIAADTPLTGPPDVVQNFNPAYLPDDSTMYQDLSNSNEMVSFSVDLSQSLTRVLSDDGIVSALPYIAMILVVLGTSVVQQRQIQGRSTNMQTNSQQQMLMKIMPYMLPIFAIAMPAALLVYFIMSNLFRVAQQAYITRSMYGEHGDSIEVIRPDTSKKKGAAKPGVTAAGRPKSSSKRSSGSDTKKKSTATSKSEPSTASARSRRTTAGEGGSSGGHSGRTTAAGTSQPRSSKKKRK